MEIEVDEGSAPVNVVRLRGRLDSAGVDQGETRFSAAVVARGKDTAVDLSGISFLASMGIRLFITSARALNQKGGRMVLFGASEMVQTVLEHVALDQVVPVVATQEEALARLAAAA
ncbi:MAG: STAS domain-containing protein [Pseudomonadota bacterium]